MKTNIKREETDEGDVKVWVDDELILEFWPPKLLGQRPKIKFHTTDPVIKLEALKQIR